MGDDVYYKIIYPDGTISLFSTNSKPSALLVKHAIISQGNDVVRITKQEYEELERELP